MSQLILREHQWSQIDYVRPVAAGQTIEQMLRGVAELQECEELVPLVVRVNGHEVPAELLPRVRPKPGAIITVVPDEISGGSARQILGAVALIALTVFTGGVASGAYLGGVSVAGLSGAGLAAAISIVGTLAINALIKPPSPEGFGEMNERWNQLTGSQNSINPWGVIPLVIGESRLFPPHAALPYTQSVGEYSYQICMFDLGHGELDVSDIRIGDSPLSNFEDVEYEITRTPTLYRDDVQEEQVNAELEEFDEATRTTAPNVEEISFDIVFTGGLFWRGTKPPDAHLRVDFEVHYRPVGGSWTPLPSNARVSGLSGTGAVRSAYNRTRTPFAVSARWDVPAGQYDVRIRRLEKTHPDDQRNTYVESAMWTVLRSVRHTDPSTTGTNKLCLRIRANDQVTGTLQTLSCRVVNKVREFDPDAGVWSDYRSNCNPAWVVWDLMTRSAGLSTHVPPQRMDRDGFLEFAEFCDAHGLKARMVLDTQMNARDLINKILTGSMGRLSHRDGRYTVIYDHGDQTPTMTFTPLESDNFRVSRVFAEVPDALRVQFANVDADYQDDEIIVVADGYSYRGLDARGNPSSAPEATTFETLRVEQAMGPQQAWQLGRFHLAQGLYRQTTYTWDTDIAGLGTTVGDVVDVAHDVPEWGVGVGWVRSIASGTPDGASGSATLVLDREIESEDGEQYAIQFRSAIGERVVVNCTPHSPWTSTFYLQSMPAGIVPGDAAVLGVRGEETAKLIITDVSYSEDLTCSFTAVNYDERVAPYWADPPENIISEITGRDYGIPDPPNVIGVISRPDNDEVDDAGIPRSGVNIGIHQPDNVYLQLR